MMRWTAVLLPLLLGGCLLPPAAALTVATLSGMSILSTGKSIPDQAISAASDQDCSLFRLAVLAPVCRDYLAGEGNKLLALAKEWEQGPEVAGYMGPDGRPAADEHAAYDARYFPTAPALAPAPANARR